jgi:cytochrome c oxidase assembly factor CtaG
VTAKTTERVLRSVTTLAIGAIVALAIGLIIGGGASPLIFSDPGPVVRFGAPVAKLIMNLSMATAVGSLVLSAFAGNTIERSRLAEVAAWSAAIWLGSGAVNFVFTFLSASGSELSFGPEFSESLWLFATQIELGTLLALNLGFALLLSLSALAFKSQIGGAINAAIALAGLYPLAESGHASAEAGHALAVNSMLMHLVGISVWVGGLVALFAVFGYNADRAKVLTSRYSTLALFAFIIVSISGLTSGFIRLYSFEDLLSNYGLLLMGKAGLLAVLGAMGALHRKTLIDKMSNGSGFIRLASFEIFVMGLAMGLGTALAKTAPPVSGVEFVPPTAAELLSGDPLPSELTPMSWFTVWDIDVLWATISVLGILVYLNGVRILRSRGDSWSIGRTSSWIGGMLVLFYVTNGAPNAYQEYLFSVHMVGHMVLSMLVPVLLVPGAPVTLLARAQKPRTDDTRGLREWVLWAVHTPFAWIVSHPIVAALNFALSLVMFYYTPLFRWATEEHIGHQWMLVHFLITGYLFVQSIIGVDPLPHRTSFPVKLMLLIGTMAFHAFFGLGLMNEQSLLLADWFGAMGRPWGPNPLADQAIGGAFAWGVGEIPTIIMTLIAVTQWSKSDARERKRLDRASDRNGNQDVTDYNEMFEKLNQIEDRRK